VCLSKLLLVMLFVSCSSAWAVDLGYHTPESLPKIVNICGITFHRAFEESKNGVFLIEYVPENETVENWTYLFAIRKEQFPYSPIIRVKGFAEHLKRKNPDWGMRVLNNEATGDAMIDFLIWPEDNSYVEFNVWKFMQAEDRRLISYQFARSVSSGNPLFEQFIKDFKEYETEIAEAMGNFELPLK